MLIYWNNMEIMFWKYFQKMKLTIGRCYRIILLLALGLIAYSSLEMTSKDDNQVPQEFFEGVIPIRFGENSDQACNFPQLEPFSKEVMKYLRREQRTFQSCETSHPLLFNSTLDGKIIPAKGPEVFIKLKISSCCYQVITRQDDFHFGRSSECYPLSLNIPTRIPPEHEFILISCRHTVPIKPSSVLMLLLRQTNEKVKLYDIHSFIHPKKSESSSFNGENKLNIVVFGIDATSRMNFLRFMPQSYEYFTKKLGAVDFLGFNKVAGNTLPNVLPMLTSLKLDEVRVTCRKDTFDGCPFIWKLYKEAGYVTSYAEDAAFIAHFHNEQNGFAASPTDYYSRAFELAGESLVGGNHWKEVYSCYGPRLTFETLLDNVKKLLFQMSRANQPFFQFTWAGSLTHDYLTAAQLGDVPLLETLKWMETSGYFNNTVLALIGDHGYRLDYFRNTLQGQLEDRLPVFLLKIPDWMKVKYPKAYQNLLQNLNRLVTTFDVHEMLLDFLDLTQLEDSRVEKRTNILLNLERNLTLPRGISPFLPVSKNRTCETAQIGQGDCGCNNFNVISANSETVREGALVAVTEINNKLQGFHNCAKLSLSSVTIAQTSTDVNRKGKDYLLNFKTLPGGALFEAFVTYEEELLGGKWRVKGEIMRTSLYGTQSRCVDDHSIKPYCFCV